jgi:hypothetical protein
MLGQVLERDHLEFEGKDRQCCPDLPELVCRNRNEKKEKVIYQPPSPPQWKGRDSVDLAYQLNQHLLRRRK